MRLLATLAVLALLTVAFAGCTGNGGGDDNTTSSSSSSTSKSSSSSTSKSNTTSSTKTSTGPGNNTTVGNHPPTATLNASAVNGSAPLAVTFTLAGNDSDGDSLSWTLSFGDNTTAANGTGLPKTVNHTYAAAGTYTATLNVSDGKDSTNRSVTLAVTAGTPPAPTGTPITWSGFGVGTAVDICISMGTDTEPYLYFDAAYAGKWTYTATSTVPMAVIKTEWWAGDSLVANQGATGVIPAGADNVAVCGDVPTLAIDFELTLSPA